MYEKIRKAAIITFIVCLVIAAIIVISAIWGMFTNDVIGKSFTSLAILVVSSALIGIATLIREGKGFSGPKNNVQVAGAVPMAPAPDVSVGKVILYVILILIAIPFLFGIVTGMMR